MPIRIVEQKHVLFNVKKSSRYRQPTSQYAQSSESPSGSINIENKEMLQKQILGQGDYKGESHVLNDPNTSIDRGLKIDNWSLAFKGIQHRSSKYGKEHNKDFVPNELYSEHFTI